MTPVARAPVPTLLYIRQSVTRDKSESIPMQIEPSNGIPRRSQRPPGEWCRQNGVTPPPGSFEENLSLATRS